MSTRKSRSFGLVALGAVAGVLTSIGISAVAERGGTPLPLDELRQFTSVFAAIKNNYVEPVPDSDLISGAISGMLSSLDPHSAYLDAQSYEEMQTVTQGEFGGLGIEVGAEDGFVKVISPIEDTPAARAGVLAGDLVIKIDETSTKGMTLQDAVKLMRGAPKTPIRLTIVRDGVDQPIVIDIERDIIKVRSVRSKALDDGYGYVRVSQFQERTGADLVQHLRELGKNGAPKGLILDLRNDPGGLLNGAIGVSAAFLPPDVLVVSTDGRAPESRHRYLANPVDYARGERDYMRDLPEWAKTVPLVVLVNAGSASASEIVAGALQDHGRAKVMGNRTFGKGSVQVILPLSDSTGIKLTTSRYYTPNGSSIQAKGIVPDIVISDTEKGDLFRLPREADLQRHLSNQQTPDDEVRSNEMDREALKDFTMFEFGGNDDFQLQQAINLLEGRPVQTGSASGPTVVDTTPPARQRITVDGVQPSKP